MWSSWAASAARRRSGRLNRFTDDGLPSTGGAGDRGMESFQAASLANCNRNRTKRYVRPKNRASSAQHRFSPSMALFNTSGRVASCQCHTNWLAILNCRQGRPKARRGSFVSAMAPISRGRDPIPSISGMVGDPAKSGACAWGALLHSWFRACHIACSEPPLICADHQGPGARGVDHRDTPPATRESRAQL